MTKYLCDFSSHSKILTPLETLPLPLKGFNFVPIRESDMLLSDDQVFVCNSVLIICKLVSLCEHEHEMKLKVEVND